MKSIFLASWVSHDIYQDSRDSASMIISYIRSADRILKHNFKMPIWENPNENFMIQS